VDNLSHPGWRAAAARGDLSIVQAATRKENNSGMKAVDRIG